MKLFPFGPKPKCYFSDVGVLHGGLKSIVPEARQRAAVQWLWGAILVAGVVCTFFSFLNSSGTHWEEGLSGYIYQGVIENLKVIRPYGFVIENVVIASHLVSNMIEDLWECGCVARCVILSPTQFMTSQCRRRLFIFGTCRFIEGATDRLRKIQVMVEQVLMYDECEAFSLHTCMMHGRAPSSRCPKVATRGSTHVTEIVGDEVWLDEHGRAFASMEFSFERFSLGTRIPVVDSGLPGIESSLYKYWAQASPVEMVADDLKSGWCCQSLEVSHALSRVTGWKGHASCLYGSSKQVIRWLKMAN